MQKTLQHYTDIPLKSDVSMCVMSLIRSIFLYQSVNHDSDPQLVSPLQKRGKKKKHVSTCVQQR